jgi:hypothetical protein
MPEKKKCRWCEKGYERMELDADGTRTEVSRRIGVMGHAQDEYFWPCEMDHPLPRKSSREGYRDPFALLRDREQQASPGSTP